MALDAGGVRERILQARESDVNRAIKFVQAILDGLALHCQHGVEVDQGDVIVLVWLRQTLQLREKALVRARPRLAAARPAIEVTVAERKDGFGRLEGIGPPHTEQEIDECESSMSGHPEEPNPKKRRITPDSCGEGDAVYEQQKIGPVQDPLHPNNIESQFYSARTVADHAALHALHLTVQNRKASESVESRLGKGLFKQVSACIHELH